MNKIFQIVFNAARGKMMAVNEATSSVQTGKKAATVVIATVLMAASATVSADITGGTWVGTGEVTVTGDVAVSGQSFLDNTTQTIVFENNLNGDSDNSTTDEVVVGKGQSMTVMGNINLDGIDVRKDANLQVNGAVTIKEDVRNFVSMG